jgi:hypothetical protein
MSLIVTHAALHVIVTRNKIIQEAIYARIPI